MRYTNRDTNKEDVFIALKSFQNYIENIAPEDFELFLQGRPVFGAMLPPNFNLMSGEPEHFVRSITRLEFRIS